MESHSDGGERNPGDDGPDGISGSSALPTVDDTAVDMNMSVTGPMASQDLGVALGMFHELVCDTVPIATVVEQPRRTQSALPDAKVPECATPASKLHMHAVMSLKQIQQ